MEIMNIYNFFKNFGFGVRERVSVKIELECEFRRDSFECILMLMGRYWVLERRIIDKDVRLGFREDGFLFYERKKEDKKGYSCW